MRIYRWFWSGTTLIVGVVLGFATVQTFTPFGLIGIALVGLLCGGLLYTLRSNSTEGRVALGYHLGLGVATCVVAASPLSLPGVPAVVVVVCLLLISPWSLTWAAHRLTRFRAAGADGIPAARPDLGSEPSDPRQSRLREEPSFALIEVDQDDLPTVYPDCSCAQLGMLTDESLCLAWRRSYVAMQRETDVLRRQQLASTRQCLLDELERRNPRGFLRWLYDGARPASNPSKYLQSVGEVDQKRRSI